MIRKTTVLKVALVTVCATLIGGAATASQLTSPVSALDGTHERGENRGGSKGRVVEAVYSTGVSFGVQDLVTACVFTAPINSCVLAPAGLNERYASIEIVDASGLPVPAFVGPHDDDPAGKPICGTTSKPIPITPGIEVEVVLNAFDPAVPCAGVATTGMVKFTFTKRP